MLYQVSGKIEIEVTFEIKGTKDEDAAFEKAERELQKLVDKVNTDALGVDIDGITGEVDECEPDE